VLGPDNAWERLQQMLDWFAEVQAAGGYRAYYDRQSRPGRLQGVAPRVAWAWTTSFSKVCWSRR